MTPQPDPAEALAAIAEARRGVHDPVAVRVWRRVHRAEMGAGE